MPELIAPNGDSTWPENPLVQAVAGEIPVVRTIATIWTERVRSRREQRLYAFLMEVAGAINALRALRQGDVDVAHVGSDEFANTMANVTEVAVREHDEDKRKYLEQFIVNYSKHHRPDSNLTKVFFQFVVELTGIHLVLLDEVYKAQCSLSDADLSVLEVQVDRPEAPSLNALSRILRVQPDLVALLSSMLESRGLLVLRAVPGTLHDSSPRAVMRPVARAFMDFLKA